LRQLSEKKREIVEPKVIFEDTTLLVLDKPSGWVVNDADTTKHLKTIQNWLQEKYNYEIVKNRQLRSGIVHRLDKDTSGILLVAKTESVFKKLQAQFKERVVQKTYVALAHGAIDPNIGEITAPVGRLPWNKRKFGVIPGGREASTKYKVTKVFQKDGQYYSLLDLHLKTGRTHQIRVHLRHLGSPIVADKTYAGRKTWRHDIKWCPRIFLHASEISFIHPGTGKKVTLKAETPEDLKNVIDSLESEVI